MGMRSPQGGWYSRMVSRCVPVPFSRVQAPRVPQGWLHPGRCSHPKIQPHHAVLTHHVGPGLREEATFAESS